MIGGPVIELKEGLSKLIEDKKHKLKSWGLKNHPDFR